MSTFLFLQYKIYIIYFGGHLFQPLYDKRIFCYTLFPCGTDIPRFSPVPIGVEAVAMPAIRPPESSV